MDLNFDDLAFFLAVDRTGSIAAASRELGPDPSTVSRRIGRLEKQLGVTLFVRTGRGMVLSEAGETLARRAQAAMNQVALGIEEVQRQPDRLAGVVRVTSPTEIGSAFVVPELPLFRERHPDVVVELELGAHVVDLTRREADLALRTFRPTQGDIVTRRIGGTPIRPFHAASLPTELARVHWLDWIDETPGVAQWAGPEARVVMRSNDLAGLRAACVAGVGTALLPALIGKRLDLVPLEGFEPVMGPPLWMAAPRTSLELPRVRALWDFVLERFEALRE